MDQNEKGKASLIKWLSEIIKLAHNEFSLSLMKHNLKPTIDSTIEFLLQYICYNIATLFEARHPHKQILIEKQIYFDQAAHISSVLLRQQIDKQDIVWQTLARDYGKSVFDASHFFSEYMHALVGLDQLYTQKNLSGEIEEIMYKISQEEYMEKVQHMRVQVPELLWKWIKGTGLMIDVLYAHDPIKGLLTLHEYLCDVVLLGTMMLSRTFSIEQDKFSYKLEEMINLASSRWVRPITDIYVPEPMDDILLPPSLRPALYVKNKLKAAKKARKNKSE